MGIVGRHHESPFHGLGESLLIAPLPYDDASQHRGEERTGSTLFGLRPRLLIVEDGEHLSRIAYGSGEQRLESGVEIPAALYQVVLAQTDEGVRAVAMLFPQDISPNAYPTRFVVSIAELESLAGIDFLPDLDSFIAKPLKAHVPTRLWPVGLVGAFRLIAARLR